LLVETPLPCSTFGPEGVYFAERDLWQVPNAELGCRAEQFGWAELGHQNLRNIYIHPFGLPSDSRKFNHEGNSVRDSEVKEPFNSYQRAVARLPNR